MSTVSIKKKKNLINDTSISLHVHVLKSFQNIIICKEFLQLCFSINF